MLILRRDWIIQMGFEKQIAQSVDKGNKPKWAPYVSSRYVIYDGNFWGSFKLLSPHVVVLCLEVPDGVHSWKMTPFTHLSSVPIQWRNFGPSSPQATFQCLGKCYEPSWWYSNIFVALDRKWHQKNWGDTAHAVTILSFFIRILVTFSTVISWK